MLILHSTSLSSQVWELKGIKALLPPTWDGRGEADKVSTKEMSGPRCGEMRKEGNEQRVAI